MTIQVLDPTHGAEAPAFALATRPKSLEGATVGVISNGKSGTKPFFQALEQRLKDTYGVSRVEQVIKGNLSAPAEPEIMDRARQWNALVAGIGD